MYWGGLGNFIHPRFESVLLEAPTIAEDVKQSGVFDLSNHDALNYIQLNQELDELKAKKDYLKELKALHQTINDLKNTIKERDIAISVLNMENKVCEEDTTEHLKQPHIVVND